MLNTDEFQNNQNKKIKLLSLFSGIGAFERALQNLNLDFELVNYCEINKYASKAYSLIHNVSEDKNLRDVTKVDTSKLPSDIDLITYGFPCQNISIAGLQKGFEHEGKRTRSGLFFEALRIIEDTKPKYAIAENVKALVSNKFKNEFSTVLRSLNKAGYNNYWKVLNAKDYGIPQNRERVFIVSVRKDIDDKMFQFPKSKKLNLRLKDILESNVDEKYYLSDEFIKNNLKCEIRESEYIGNDNKPVRIYNIYGYTGCSFGGNIYDKRGISPTLDTMQGGNRQPMIISEKDSITGCIIDSSFTSVCEPILNKSICPTFTTSNKLDIIIKD